MKNKFDSNNFFQCLFFLLKGKNNYFNKKKYLPVAKIATATIVRYPIMIDASQGTNTKLRMFRIYFKKQWSLNLIINYFLILQKFLRNYYTLHNQ